MGMAARELQLIRLLSLIFLDHRQPEKAVVLLEALQELAPMDEYGGRALAGAYLAAGRHLDALHAADACMQGMEAQAAAPLHLIRSRALWGLDREEEARAALRRYIQLRGEP